ncbi:alpha/beta fold hydrolase [Rhodococcoides fascians]|uniref:alpha/beta fold hydrolase n=2 Tax=Nocardiaceae TaxID=85025 RepID=UPI00352FF729
MVARLPRTQPDARILYGDSPLNCGDLRIPEGTGDERHPLVILIHGGAWESSYTSEYFGQLSEAFADVGMATWNLEFRRKNNSGGAFPGMFLDVANGVDYARQLAEEYPIDLDRVVLLGHSSGGHLAAWAAGRLGGWAKEHPCYRAASYRRPPASKRVCRSSRRIGSRG